MCEWIGSWEGMDVGLSFVVVEGWLGIWCDDIVYLGLLFSCFYDIYTLDDMFYLYLLNS